MTLKDSRMTCDVLEAVAAEYQAAAKKHYDFHSAHEGYAAILEELDELWDEVKRRDKDISAMRKEAIQVAAMAVRFILDVCPPEREYASKHAHAPAPESQIAIKPATVERTW